MDSLTRHVRRGLRLALSPCQGPNKYDMRAVYGDAQDAIESTSLCYSRINFATNVIVISHIRYMERQDGMTKGYPKSIGSALSP